MRFILPFILVLTTSLSWAADGSVTVPWAEFRQMFAQQVERALAPETGDQEPPVYSIDSADYELELEAHGVEGRVTLEGRVLKGRPEPFRVFAEDLAVTGVDTAEGATLIGDARGYRLYLDTQDRFRLVLRIAAPLREERTAHLLSLRVPAAVRNSVHLNLPDHWRLLSTPGLRPSGDRYFFAPAEHLSLRLLEVGDQGASLPPMVDTFSRVTLHGDNYLFTTWLAPLHVPPAGFTLQLPAGARLVDTSLDAGQLRQTGSGALPITLPDGWKGAFRVRFELPAGADRRRLRLPFVPGNTGREGEFRLAQPADARIELGGESYRRGLPYRQLPDLIRAAVEEPGPYARAPLGGDLELLLTRFDGVDAPLIVLDTVHLYTSFTDTGRTLSVLRLELPPESGDRLTLDAVAGSEVWSLRVNGHGRRLYRQAGDRWVIPLERHKTSVVELAYLTKSEPLGLKGRLELKVPATGIAARRLHAAIGLAERVELVAMEGDLVPAQGGEWPQVQELTGTAYHFVHPYYRGEALKAAVYYQEPVRNEHR